MKSNQELSGKTILVTGATAGIGKIAATAMAEKGANVIIVGRNQQKTSDTVQQIIAATGNKDIQSLVADFSDLRQVSQLAQQFKEKYTRLDVLINNAGAFFNTRKKTDYGVEMTFLVNHLAGFYLTNLLLDVIKQSAPSRIINVSSDAHRSGKLNFNDLEFKRFYFGMLAYARSKLANILFTYELSRRLEGSDVTVNALHPGHIATDIWRNSFSIFGPALKWLMSKISLTPEQGADNTIYMASSADVEGVTGKYFVKHAPVQSAPITYDIETAQKLWTVSENIISLYG